MNRIVSSLAALILMAGSLTANCYALSTADRKSPDWDFNNQELGKDVHRNMGIFRVPHDLKCQTELQPE